ncbi:3-deoxy-7-phosphoheptulonate synthase, partial [bacterium]|nr:3-deoxy-7-phosphoheptulonate synthase [bacterium]
MIIIMRRDAEKKDTTDLISMLAEKGLSVHRSTGESRTVLGIIGDIRSLDRRELEMLPGVHEVIPVSKPYKLASREFHPEGTKVSIGSLTIGNSEIAVFGGPCAVESEDMIHKIAREIHAVGGVGLRGGAFKPRTSPYSFAGLGEDGLRFLSEAARENSLVSISEVMEISQIDVVAKYCDILQIGMRNMSNFNLLRALGTCGKPLMLKRGNAATYEEW